MRRKGESASGRTARHYRAYARRTNDRALWFVRPTVGAYILTALTALTALHDEVLDHIVADPGTRTVWWAYDTAPLDGEGWTV